MLTRRAFVLGLLLSAGILGALTAAAVGQTCVDEPFNYPDGPLDLQGGWTGGGSLVQVSGGAVSLPFAVGTGVDGPDEVSSLVVDCGPCEDGTITVLFKVKATAGAHGGFAWGMQFIDDVAGLELARWYGKPATARPRIANAVLGERILNGGFWVDGMTWTNATKRLSKSGGFAGYTWTSGDTIDVQEGGPTGTVVYKAYAITAKIDDNTIELAEDINGVNGDITGDTLLGGLVTLVDAPADEMKVVINTVTNRTEFFQNGASLGSLSHGGDNGGAGWFNAGNRLSRIEITHWNRDETPGFSGNLLIDDLQIVGCSGTCSAGVTPIDAQLAYAVAGQPASPAAIAYTVLNNNQESLSYTVEKVDSSGAPCTAACDWLSLDKTGGTLDATQSEVVTASLDTTGLSAGLHFAYLKLTSCDNAWTYLRAIKLYIDNPLTEDFNYPDMLMDRAPGWTESTISSTVNPIQLISGAVRLSGGTYTPGATVTARHLVSDAYAGCPLEGGVFSVKMKIKAGAGVSNICDVFVDGLNGNRFFYWRAKGTEVKGNSGGADAGPSTLTGDWDQLEVIVNTKTYTCDFYFNSVKTGSSSIVGGDAGLTVTAVRIVQLNNGSTSDFVSFDDLNITPCGALCNDPVFDVRSEGGVVGPDQHVDIWDYNAFEACATGPGLAAELSFECKCMDLNDDSTIDQTDFAVFQRCYSGSAETADTTCDD